MSILLFQAMRAENAKRFAIIAGKREINKIKSFH
jgi:hypothetical protein